LKLNEQQPQPLQQLQLSSNANGTNPKPLGNDGPSRKAKRPKVNQSAAIGTRQTGASQPKIAQSQRLPIPQSANGQPAQQNGAQQLQKGRFYQLDRAQVSNSKTLKWFF
jgi:hypothetical protein